MASQPSLQKYSLILLSKKTFVFMENNNNKKKNNKPQTNQNLLLTNVKYNRFWKVGQYHKACYSLASYTEQTNSFLRVL